MPDNKISRIKHYASYLFELPIEELESKYSGTVRVSYHKGTYKLSTHHVIYSFGKYYTSFSIPFNALQIETAPIQTVLILGLGLGSIINLLEKNPSIEKIDAVEIDDVVIDCSKKYLDSPHKKKICYYNEDVFDFLRLNKETQYDLVLFDVFIDDQTPMDCMESHFLELLKNKVKQNGTLLFSKLNYTPDSVIENNSFSYVFQSVFPEAFTILAQGNLIYCWRRGNE